MNDVQYRQYLCDKVKQCKTAGEAWVDATTADGVDLRLKIVPRSVGGPHWRLDNVNVVYKHKGRVYLGHIDCNCQMQHGQLMDEGCHTIHRMKGTFPKCRYTKPGSELAFIREIHVKP